MTSADPWAGMIDPRAALRAAREASENSRKLSQVVPESCESGSVVKSETCDEFSSFRSFRSPPLPLSHSRGENPKEREITCSSSISEAYAYSASSAGLLEPHFDGLSVGGPAKAAKLRKQGLTHYDCSESAFADACERFAIPNTVPSPTAHLQGPPDWRDGLARLNRWTPPCEGFRSGEWEAMHRGVSHFMDHFAVEAAARGWTALDLFGVHSRAGAARVDSCGALMLPLLKNASALTAEAITFGPLTYRRRPMPEAVLVWDFVGEAA